ncbi:hypothetical protein FQA39_LY03263 [Lamprigera yunnana]|nr:hypothetical protein FQA39_LY03263 [Lamprigera yunnana]
MDAEGNNLKNSVDQVQELDVNEDLEVEEPDASKVVVDEEDKVKRVVQEHLELDDIQVEVNDLMTKLNSFIFDTMDDSTDGSGDDVTERHEDLNEKQDGPSEKELRCKHLSSDDYYISDGSSPPEINWNIVGPVLQKHISDLQRLQSLNQETHSVVKRIRNVAQISEALMGNLLL